jgi:hypothetical protein
MQEKNDGRFIFEALPERKAIPPFYRGGRVPGNAGRKMEDTQDVR